MEFDNALREYWDRFGEPFPMEQFGGSEEDAVEEMARCLASGEPYSPDPDVKW